MAIESYRELRVWQAGVELVSSVYCLTESFPESEKYGLVSQMRRCAVSIPSNIAEGFGRGSKPDYIRFLKIARGSVYEFETQLEISINLGFCEKANIADLLEQNDKVVKMLASLIRSLENK